MRWGRRLRVMRNSQANARRPRVAQLHERLACIPFPARNRHTRPPCARACVIDTQYKDPKLPPEQQAVTAAPDVAVARLAAEGGGGGGDGIGCCGMHISDGPAVRGGDPAAALHPRLLVVACDGLWDVMSRQQVCHDDR